MNIMNGNGTVKMTDNDLNVRDEFKNLTVPEIQNIAKQNLNPFAVCVLNVTGGLNISTIIRSAHNFGAQEVIIFGKPRFDRRGMVGSQNYTEITKVPGLDDGELDLNVFNQLMFDRKYMPIFVETGGVPLNNFKWKTHIRENSPTPCLIFGNENTGIPIDFMRSQMLQYIITIPNVGVMRSYNVAAAASIIMWDLVNEMNWV